MARRAVQPQRHRPQRRLPLNNQSNKDKSTIQHVRIGSHKPVNWLVLAMTRGEENGRSKKTNAASAHESHF